MLTDDLPWPELGNVSRGATRGNQGQKGVLGPPDNDGRAILQLRVQPGVLCVKLNRQATDWYRILDTEVNNALKLTKTYWRKARRRQDYDARADQDHMELHEWLQQLKDKVMSHLELLMQKGDIQGMQTSPPYVMPDDIELPFLRKFIERQAQGIAHNPRLRNLGQNPKPIPEDALESMSDGNDESGYHIPSMNDSKMGEGSKSSMYSPQTAASHSHRSQFNISTREGLSHAAQQSMQRLQGMRTQLIRAQKDTQDAFRRYTQALESERMAREDVLMTEKQRDELMYMLLQHSQNPGPAEVPSRHSSASLDEHQRSPREYHRKAYNRFEPQRPGMEMMHASGSSHPPPPPPPSWATATGPPPGTTGAEPDSGPPPPPSMYPISSTAQFPIPNSHAPGAGSGPGGSGSGGPGGGPAGPGAGGGGGGGGGYADHTSLAAGRKHPRDWDGHEQQLHSMPSTHYEASPSIIPLFPQHASRKRIHVMNEYAGPNGPPGDNGGHQHHHTAHHSHHLGGATTADVSIR